MELKTKVVKSSKSVADLFEFLSKTENYEKLMPENTQSFRLHDSGKGFFVRIGNMPEVGMRQKSLMPNAQIIFESPSENFNYDLTIDLLEEQGGSSVQLFFKGSFNAMIEMMAKKPLKNFIDTIANKLEAT